MSTQKRSLEGDWESARRIELQQAKEARERAAAENRKIADEAEAEMERQRKNQK